MPDGLVGLPVGSAQIEAGNAVLIMDNTKGKVGGYLGTKFKPFDSRVFWYLLWFPAC
jgi:hypothetical protein